MNHQQAPIEELDTDALLELILQGCFTCTEMGQSPGR